MYPARAAAAHRRARRAPRSPLAASPWRARVVDALAPVQRADGAWQNASGGMLEDEALIATGEAMRALACVLEEKRPPAPSEGTPPTPKGERR